MTKKFTSFSPAGQSWPVRVSLYLLIILLLATTALAQETYQTWGVDRANTYQQDGSGVWTGVSPGTYQRTGNYQSKPLVADVDNDGISEIIVVNNVSLEVLNITAGGVVLETTYNFFTNNYASANDFYQTPAIFDHDSDGYLEIVLFNVSHMIVFQWNGTGNSEDMVVTTGIGTGSGSQFAAFPTIKCAPSNLWSSNNDTCVLPVRNRTTLGLYCALALDLDAEATHLGCKAAMPNSDTLEHNTHLADGDNDGFLEVYLAYEDAPNDDMEVWAYEVPSMAATQLFDHALSGTTDFTDIIVNNLDGTVSNGLEITWGFTADGTNWDAYTVSARDCPGAGCTVENSYCTVLTCPEGNAASRNLVQSTDTTYCPFSGDVYYYIRNWDTNVDTIHCISRFAGSATQETGVANTVNFTGAEWFLHQANLFGATGVLTSQSGVNGATKQNTPAFVEGYLVPVDYQRTGSLDVLGVNRSSGRFTYYDDLYTNQLPVISSQSIGTGNPVCKFVIQRVIPSVTDTEGDDVTCFVEQSWANGTSITNTSNTTVTPPNSMEFQLVQNVEGTFTLTTRCTDQYNDAFATRSYVMTVSNDTNVCKQQDQSPVEEEFVSDDDAAGDEEFLTGWNNVLGNYNVDSGRAKGVVWLLVMVFVVVGSVIVMVKSGAEGTYVYFSVLIITAAMLLMGWYLEMVSTVALVILGLVLALILTIMIAGRVVSE